MAESRTEYLRRAYAALDAGDPSLFVDRYDPDIVLVVAHDPRVVPEVGTFTGKAAVENWFAEYFRAFRRGFRHIVTEVIEAGDSVITDLDQTYTGRRSGLEARWEDAVAVYTFRADAIIRIDIPASREAAREMVGIAGGTP